MSAFLTLPIPLRPEHRLAHLITAAAAVNLTSLHPLLTQLQSCTSERQSWLMQQPGAHTAGGAAADLTNLPIPTRKHLLQMDEESQRLHEIYSIVAPFANPTPAAPIVSINQETTRRGSLSRSSHNSASSISGLHDIAPPVTPASPPSPSSSPTPLPHLPFHAEQIRMQTSNNIAATDR
jgi:hypothetical protein